MQIRKIIRQLFIQSTLRLSILIKKLDQIWKFFCDIKFLLLQDTFTYSHFYSLVSMSSIIISVPTLLVLDFLKPIILRG